MKTEIEKWQDYVSKAVGLEELEIKIKRLSDKAVIPTYAHDGDVGMDLTAIDVEYDKEKDMYVYHTGIALESDKHYGVLLFPRSSNRKTDAYICNHVPVIDTAIYRGEIMVCFKNRDSLRQIALESRVFEFMNSLCSIPTIHNGFEIREYTRQESMHNALNAWNDVLNNPMDFAPYNIGDRICQMVVIPYPNVVLKEVDELSESVRGTNGFGSTGN